MEKKEHVKQEDDLERLKPVKSLLVSQPEPKNGSSPYHSLADRFGLKVDFRKFIQVQAVPYKEFKEQKVDILEYTAVIFTSRNAVDNFFRICKEAKVEMPAETKYFCISEQTAHYLQKYITIRKRKLFVGDKTAQDLIKTFEGHEEERFLYPCSDIRKDDIPDHMNGNGYAFTEAVLYRTVACDLSDLAHVNYDIVAFFSPSGIKSLFTNFPDFKQRNTRIAAFGPTTAKAVKDHGLILDIQAPSPNAPSMTGAISEYIKKVDRVNK